MPVQQVNNNVYISFSNIPQTQTLPLPSCLRIPAICITAKSLFYHPRCLRHGYRQSLRHLLSVTTPNKTITYWFSIIFLFDIFPTCLRHFSPTYTSALPPLLPPNYRQNNICTDILHRQKASTFSVNRPAAKLITFAKLSQKGKNKKI